MSRQNISSASPFEPLLGFSRAVRIGNTIAVSGTAPIGPDGKTVGAGDVAAQVRRCCAIAEEVLAKAGAGLSDVVRTRVYLTDAANWEVAGLAHGAVFREICPAATMVVVKALLDPDWLVEMEFDAVIGEEAGERKMTPSELRESNAPPEGASGPLEALWHLARGDWHKAHEVVQADDGPEAAWVHAHIHRVEGDESNAAYWYARAGKPPENGPLGEEWDIIAEALMTEGGL